MLRSEWQNAGGLRLGRRSRCVDANCRIVSLAPTRRAPAASQEEIAAEFGDAASEVSWPRPPPAADVTSKAIAFQWVDIDFYDGDPLPVHPRRELNVPGARSGIVPVLRMFGVTDAGNSVCAHVHGFTPYLWTAPPGPMGEEDILAFKDSLEKQMIGSKRGRMDACVRAVLLVPEKQSLLGYHGGRKQPMLQIFVATHACVSAAKGVLERGFSFGRFPPRSVRAAAAAAVLGALLPTPPCRPPAPAVPVL